MKTTIIAAVMLLATSAFAQQLWTGCVAVNPTATATSTPAVPTATPTPTAPQVFSSISVANLVPWRVGNLGSIFGAIARPDLVRSMNVFVDGVQLPSYQLGAPAGAPSWTYPLPVTNTGFTSYWTPTTPGTHTITFIAYSDLAATQPLNVPSAFVSPPTLYTRTITP